VVHEDVTYFIGDIADVPRADELIGSGSAEPIGVELAELGYRELQAMAKERGIAANQSRDDLINALNE
jgi:hypothetical protein